MFQLNRHAVSREGPVVCRSFLLVVMVNVKAMKIVLHALIKLSFILRKKKMTVLLIVCGPFRFAVLVINKLNLMTQDRLYKAAID